MYNSINHHHHQVIHDMNVSESSSNNERYTHSNHTSTAAIQNEISDWLTYTSDHGRFGIN